jgi:hypothetical protein
MDEGAGQHDLHAVALARQGRPGSRAGQLSVRTNLRRG